MKKTLAPGLTHGFSYRVPANKTVPDLYPEIAEFQAMPTVFATGFMVGLMEWACTHDGVDTIGEGRHQRYVVAWEKFNTRLAQKVSQFAIAVESD
jgi:fluoroacetyl-CoA thioesterase